MNAQYAYQYFIKQGYAPHQAAAIVGNLMQESGQGLDVNALGENDAGPGLHSRGIGQWNRDRLANLQRYAAAQGRPWNDLETQLGFVNWELNNTEIGAGKALRAAGNIDDATAAFIGYERPQGWTAANPRGGHGFGNRLANAQSLAGLPQTAAAPAPMGASLGSFTGGMTDVALRQPAIVQPIPAGDLPPAAEAGGAGGKGGPGNSPYERQMRNAMEKEGRPQREIDAGMAQAANVKSPSLPSMGGGKSMPDMPSLGGGGGKGGMSTGAKGDLQGTLGPAPVVQPTADTGPGYELPPVITAPKAPIPTAKPASQNMNFPPVQGPNQPYFDNVDDFEMMDWNSGLGSHSTQTPGGVPYDASKSPAWDYTTKRFMPPVRPR